MGTMRAACTTGAPLLAEVARSGDFDSIEKASRRIANFALAKEVRIRARL